MSSTLEIVYQPSGEISAIDNATQITVDLNLSSIGQKGDTGPANVLSINSVTSGANPSVTISGTSPAQSLNFVLPFGAYSRSTVSGQSSSIEPYASESIDIQSFLSYFIQSITVSSPAWVRIYSNQESRTSDLNRSINIDAPTNSGLICEIISYQSGTIPVSPFVSGGDTQINSSGYCFLTVTNLSDVASSIAIDLQLLRLEH